MDIMVALLAVMFGAGLGWFAAVARQSPPDLEADPPGPTLSPQLLSAVDLQTGAALVVDTADVVQHATAPALTTGLVRGKRVRQTELLDLIRRIRADGAPISTKLTIPVGAMSSRDLAVRATPLEGGFVLVITQDLSAQTRADEIKRDFTANVSHELKTPVGALKVLAEAVEEASDDPEAVRHFAGRMTHEADRLAMLVSQIIELNQLQSTDPLTSADVVEIDQVVAEACDRATPAAIGREITITRSGEPQLRVFGDQEQLTTALSNLIQNAINYSDPGARVTVSVATAHDEDDEFVEMRVTDNGIGIAEQDLERIFERFYRADFARSRATGGTGLGLSIVKHSMVAHGGSVNVWSKLGEGSTFTLRLPKFTDELAQLPHSSPLGDV